MVRGALPPAVAGASDPLSAAAAAFSSPSSSSSSSSPSPSPSPATALLAEIEERGESLYVSDASSMSVSGGGGPWGVVPRGAGCALAQPIFRASSSSEETGAAKGEDGRNGKNGRENKGRLVGLLLLAGDRPRALSVRDRAWARSVARKLSPVVVGMSE